MIFPRRRSTMPGSAARVQRNVPTRFTMIVLTQASLSLLIRGPMGPNVPALLTRTSMRPNRSRAAPASAFTCCASETSTGTAIASPPWEAISPAVLSISIRVRAAATTLAPSRARPRAISLPIPRPAPVTTATRSFSLAPMVVVLEPASGLLPAGGSATEPLPYQRPDRPERLPPAGKLALAAHPGASLLEHLYHPQPPPQRPGDDARLVVPAVVRPEVHPLRDLSPEGVVAGAEVREAGAVQQVADGGDGAVAKAPVQRLGGEAGSAPRSLFGVVAQEQRLHQSRGS